MADTLYPPNVRDARTDAFAACIASAIRGVSLAPLLVYLIDDVDASALPHLAEQFNVYGRSQWQLCQTDTDKRNLIKNAVPVHRKKGTPWAIQQAILAVGFDAVDVVTRTPTWTDIQVYVRGRPITANDASLIKDVIDEFAPARCTLNQLAYGQIEIWSNDGLWGNDADWGGYEPYALV